ncbi:sodium/proton antiporter complex Mrp, protein D [Syntrophotalea carbinolica DSM 2380]|uniref:Sodium/proton antiporter complex Mrp, protein D n=1 Tax=Syntrophotalea carbinolica (strain DSM 2380 / NBRC 103641 / GraBd1) TaxID=338963 RepID=Q3A1A0_SYNC1|nr:proton-conducting transporter membrane subunit [Syntrophotalea carbinolica]ABA89857.1 sodium/proton antiporter complex Mrp, protein D [Syntrophotalea carbinolica DSM 2380]
MPVITPLLLPLLTALLCVLTRSDPHRQRNVSLGGALGQLFCAGVLLRRIVGSGPLTMVAGNWPLPFGIEFTADRLGISLVLVAAVMVTVVVVWQRSDVDIAPESPALHPLLHGLVAGACGAFLTADLFNLYVWFELALICSLGLLAQGGTLRHLDATFKYFALNLVGTLLLLAAVALLYAYTGQLNFTALGTAAAGRDGVLLLPLIGLLALAFLIKAAAFPFFSWLPSSYHTLPAPVLALFSALLSKVGICALIRILGGVLHPAPEVLFRGLGWIALISMVTGVLGAAYHWDLRRILAFHSISQVGYMLLALALASRAGNAAAIFFALHHSLVKAGLFLVAGMIYRHVGHYDLRRIGGLYAAKPGLATLFLILSLSLVGLPPSSGFWGKYLIVRESIVQGEYLWAGTALAVGLLTLYSMMKIWLEAFWKPHPDSTWHVPAGMRLAPAYAGVGVLILAVVWVGVYPGGLLGFVGAAATGLWGGPP